MGSASIDADAVPAGFVDDPINGRPTWWLTVAAAVVVVVLGILIIVGNPDRQTIRPMARGEAIAAQDPVKKAVRDYLKKNFGSGEWEEVEWGRVTEVPEGKALERPAHTHVELKLRTANEAGEKTVRHATFRVADGKVISAFGL